MNRMMLQLPQLKMKRIHRPELAARLDDLIHLPRGVALLTAPAGFGKTTLAADWAAGKTSHTAWLSVNVEDNDVFAFLQNLIDAVRRVEAEVGQEALQMIQSPQPLSYLVVLKSLLHDLNKLSLPLYLVLDDYQVISTSRVREMINTLLDNFPPALRLIILSRSNPSLALPRLRKEERLIEIGAADLRFSEEEAQFFLRESMGLDLSTGEIALLNQRIEGWPAGLQMAGLALQGRQDPIDFIHHFSGSSPYILDYLAGAVFDRQEKDLQIFLLKTSISSSINASLAWDLLQTNSINGYEDSPGGQEGVDCQTILENLFQSNMFVTPLDEQHTWFRYHPLFSDLLRTRLHIVDHPAFKGLHLKACAWYRQNGDMVGAVNHALMAEEAQYAVQIFEQHAKFLLTLGNISALERWVGMLVEDDIKSRPWLCISQAWVMAFNGNLTGLDSLLKQAEQLSKQDADEEQHEISGHVSILRAFLAILTGDVMTAVKLCRAASQQLTPGSHWVNGMYHWAAGTAARVQGKLEQSAESFQEMKRIGQAVNNRWTLLTAATEQGLVLYVQGNLKEARHIFEDALETAHQQNVQSYGCVSRLQTALANIDYEQGQLKAALNLVEDAIAGNRFWKNPNHLIYAYATRAHIQIGSGEFLGAKDTLEQADHEMRSLPVLGTVAALLNAAKVRLWLSSGERSLAADWAAGNKSSFSEKAFRKLRRSYQEDLELNQTTAIRIMLSDNLVEDAVALLDQLLPDAFAGGRNRAVLKFTILRALAEDQAGSTPIALDWLDQAVQQAAEQEYVQVFIDEGPAVERLLKELAESDRLGSGYANRLLSAIAAPKPVIQFTPVSKPVLDEKHPMTRSLSQREMEVLNLIAEGLTNHQIAVRLIISTGTVKAHSANIYRKLVAGNRFQAVERARALKLLV